MKIFISSVRGGLEEERDALPAMIRALGHEPRRFEDHTAKSAPSREACLAGVEEADAYVLLLGERYGDPLPDTGKAPTEEEFVVAKRRGIPILAFRKRDVDPEPAQGEFIRRIEDYASGVFRGSFANATELLPHVAAAIRDLERVPAALVFEPLTGPVAVPWKAPEGRGWRPTVTTVELHAIPVPPRQLSATSLSALPRSLARAGREHGLFADDYALDTAIHEGAAHATTRPDVRVPVAGVRMMSSGSVTVWQGLPSDSLGVILDAADVAARVATMVRLASELVPQTGAVALAIGLYGLGSVSEGSAADLGRRSSASLAGFLRQSEAALVEPRDKVSVAALSRAAEEIAGELVMRLLLRFREATR